MSGKHGPNGRANYFTIHATVMGRYIDEGFVVHDGLVVEHIEPSASIPRGGYFMVGRIECVGGITIDVKKVIAIVADAPREMVQTVEYTYHVHAAELGNVFRYCSPHDDDGGGHHDSHHRHTYDVLGDDPTSCKVTCIPQLDDVPTLGDVLEEAHAWYYGNLAAIEERRKGRERLRARWRR